MSKKANKPYAIIVVFWHVHGFAREDKHSQGIRSIHHRFVPLEHTPFMCGMLVSRILYFDIHTQKNIKTKKQKTKKVFSFVFPSFSANFMPRDNSCNTLKKRFEFEPCYPLCLYGPSNNIKNLTFSKAIDI